MSTNAYSADVIAEHLLVAWLQRNPLVIGPYRAIDVAREVRDEETAMRTAELIGQMYKALRHELTDLGL